MKNNLLVEQLGRIKRLIKENKKEDSQILSEQPVPTILKKFLGGRVVSKLETSMGDDVIKNLETLFARSSPNFVKDVTGPVSL